MINLIEQLKKHEGFESNFYQCSANKTTIGYGRNVEDNPFTNDELRILGRDSFDEKPMTEDEAELLLVNDVLKIEYLIKSIVPWDKLNPARQAVCVNMAFNLGYAGFKRFKRMINAVNNSQFDVAALEMLDSRWANQVGERATDLSEQMRTGSWI